jgi:hypothetical protein
VSLFAPGEGIKCHPGSNETEEGTSLAAGFVSGYAACLATDYGLTKPDDIFQMLDSLKIWGDSYKGIVSSTGALGAVHRLEIIGPSQCARDLILRPLTLLEGKKAQNGVKAQSSQFSKPTASPSTTKAFGALESPLQQLDSLTSLFRWTRELCAPWLACFRKRPLH